MLCKHNLLENSVCLIAWRKLYETVLKLADNWDVTAHPMTKNDFGVWEVTVPAVNGAPAIPHDSKIKVSIPLFRCIVIDTLPNTYGCVDINGNPQWRANLSDPSVDQACGARSQCITYI